MPIYGYECTLCNEQFEVVQPITAEPLSRHEACGGTLRRLVYPAGIVFRGSGFHVNDYGSHGRKESNGASKKEGSSSTESHAEPASAAASATK